MAALIDSLISAALQVGIVLLIAWLAYWPLRGKAKPSFVTFLGLGTTRPLALLIGVVIGVAGAVAWLMLPGMAAIAKSPGSVVADALKGGVTPEALTALAVTGAVKSALSEEILFRGLIGKRLYAWIGLTGGNLVQALLFGAIHLVLLLALHGPLEAAAGFAAFTTLFSLAAGLLNEKLGKGAIWPGWALHASANLTTALLLAFGDL